MGSLYVWFMHYMSSPVRGNNRYNSLSTKDKAQEVLNTMTQQQHGGEAQHIFGVTCRNGHANYFDKRRVCTSNNRKVVRGDGKELDELYLKCDKCDDEMIVHVDCEGY